MSEEDRVPDVYVINQPSEVRREYVDRHVTINRAPTDESVKLLKEFGEVYT